MSRVNPRRRPATWADVEKARNEGRIEGYEYCITNILWVLKDKHDAPPEDIAQLNREMDYQMDSIIKGYVSYADIKRHLKSEYDYEFVWRK